jgi:hypothetical protein
MYYVYINSREFSATCFVYHSKGIVGTCSVYNCNEIVPNCSVYVAPQELSQLFCVCNPTGNVPNCSVSVTPQELSPTVILNIGWEVVPPPPRQIEAMLYPRGTRESEGFGETN